MGSVHRGTYISNESTLELTGNALTHEPVFDDTGGQFGTQIRSLSGDNSVGNITLRSTRIDVISGSLTCDDVAGGNGTFLSGSLEKRGPGTLAARRIRVQTSEVYDGVMAIVPGRSTDKTSVFSTFLLHPNTVFDTADNDAVIKTFFDFAASMLVEARDKLASGRGDGSWNGKGITSSRADASHFAIGYATAMQALGGSGSFSGVSVSSGNLLLRYTRYGDANIDGVVNVNDFSRLASNFGLTNKFWFDGDFNYDGNVNVLDFGLLAGNFGLVSNGANGTVTPQDWANLAAAVPEPGAASLLVPAIFAIFTSSRRSRKPS